MSQEPHSYLLLLSMVPFNSMVPLPPLLRTTILLQSSSFLTLMPRARMAAWESCTPILVKVGE